ncbi:MAG: hypothetical protein EAZ08_02430 [Cytophagales bacterium]|nr:MAG: hypothetical protein EAZ08_02430 [Cytophagales bacterium]
MLRLQWFITKIQEEVPLKIKFKDESWEMKWLNLLVKWFNPNFMTSFTTVIGYTVYFTSRKFVESNPQQAMQILTHEAVHLLDTKRFTFPIFAFLYLFPQILVVFALLFPINYYFLLCLFFLLPLPAPFRAYFEARAYAVDLTLGRHEAKNIVRYFVNWDYYRMLPIEQYAENLLHHCEVNPDMTIKKILAIYKQVHLK